MNAAIMIILGAVVLLQNVHMPAFLIKHPPTAQLDAARKAEDDARAKQAIAEKALADSKAAEQAKQTEQLAYVQRMSTTAKIAIDKVKPEQQTPETKLVSDLLSRANSGLDQALGAMAPDKRAELETLVNNALSSVAAQRDAALKELADQKDAFQAVTQERDEIKSQIPVLQAKVETQVKATEVEKANRNTLEAKVETYANEKDAEATKAGTLQAYLERLIKYGVLAFVLLGFAYYVIHFGLPSLQQEFPSNNFLTKADKFLKSVTTART
jgi:hypothetical protein